MVECIYELDPIFDSLGDKTRRDILRHVSKCEQSISEIASRYSLSFAAISKHVKVLEAAKLIKKRRNGKEQLVSADLHTMKFTADYLAQYQALWNDRFDRLEVLLKEEN